ncbi:flagellar brake protein [Herbaspirillum sp. AP02]|uniref:flagellar brake protein n=1 Tax=unclassified Herbaspirillum TaxID=2624150 RepID=UPI0015D980EF|nr:MULTISPECIES: flagellar brake protein [unclassified Herbaspirillum]MBG7618408.1 flagellar brake protein [Herbaspirillum sp. AP02]NZD68568.1 flagellar brake protein [Herbaspirillum sp. AP21]
MPNHDDIEDDSPFRVHSRREIIALLTSMMEKNQLLSLLIKGGSESVITSILEVDADDDSVIIDAAPSAMLNESIVASKRINFEALYNSIRITFAVDGASQIEYQNRPAFRVAIPESLVRLQRREYFRIPTPIAKPLRCTFRVTQTDGSFATVITLLNNISAGGVGITDEKKILPSTPGMIYEDCQLELGDNTLVSVKLQVRDCKEFKMTNGKVVNRFGCQFVDIPRTVLAAIQRFITKLEREQNAKASGMM